MRPIFRAFAFALVIGLGGASSVFAGNINETLSVNSTITVTGIPASIDYGALDPGATSPTRGFDVAVTSNASWTFKESGSAFGGAGTIAKSQRYGQFGSGNNAVISGPTSWADFGMNAFDGSTVLVSGQPGAASFHTDLRVQIPAGQAPGAYTGTITYTFTAS